MTARHAGAETITVGGVDYDMDRLCQAVYAQRSGFPMTDEKWERVKVNFPSSVRSCRDEVLQQIEDGEFE